MNSILRFGPIALGLASSLWMVATPTWAASLTVLPSDSTVAGKTIGEWSAEWWKWAFGQSVPNDAFTDTTGANADINQAGPVFFVAGTTGTNATRTFSVPEGKYLLFPLLNVAFSTLETGLAGTDLKDLTTSVADSIDSAFFSVNGDAIIGSSNYQDYRVTSPKFSFIYAADNPFGVAAGPSGDAFADGYYAMVEPLEPGTYIFDFGGGASSLDFAVEVNDTITVEAKSVPEPATEAGLLVTALLAGSLGLRKSIRVLS